MTSAKYIPDTAKALEVIIWLATERVGMDVYHVVKCAYYADKRHLNLHGRPIAGDWYEADEYGPLGKCVYGLLRRHPIEILALESNGYVPLLVGEKDHVVSVEREPNLRKLSESDIQALKWAADNYADLTFEELLVLSHEEEAYQKADGGRMRYEDMLDETPDRQERARALAEDARHAVF